MVAIAIAGPQRPLHPLHAIFLSFPFPLFLGALASDLAYRATHEMQWANFAAWLNAGGMLVGSLALLWALINLFRRRTADRRRSIVYFVLLLAMWGLGFINAFVHAKDAWAIMPEGLWLSVISTALAFAAAWTGYSSPSAREVARCARPF